MNSNTSNAIGTISLAVIIVSATAVLTSIVAMAGATVVTASPPEHTQIGMWLMVKGGGVAALLARWVWALQFQSQPEPDTRMSRRERRRQTARAGDRAKVGVLDGITPRGVAAGVAAGVALVVVVGAVA